MLQAWFCGVRLVERPDVSAGPQLSKYLPPLEHTTLQARNIHGCIAHVQGPGDGPAQKVGWRRGCLARQVVSAASPCRKLRRQKRLEVENLAITSLLRRPQRPHNLAHCRWYRLRRLLCIRCSRGWARIVYCAAAEFALSESVCTFAF
eukprot:6192708-Pleurochrysis_carterae.AAC.7